MCNIFHLFLILVLVSKTNSEIAKPKYLHPDAELDIIAIATKYGYPIESHEVQTEDGYILTLHRIPHGRNRNQSGMPVLLMHGLFSSSVDWVNMGPGAALGLLLADEGYDVWMGNQRGNTWSRKHVTIDPNKYPKEFFDFSFHEIGIYDIPAKIDYVLHQTGREDIFYVGHSQGTTAFFIMAAEKPEYNKKIRSMAALAPVAYMGNMPNPFVTPLVDHLDLMEYLINRFQVYEIFPHYDFFTELGEVLCSNSSDYQFVCVWIINAIAGFNSEIDSDFIPVITSNAPAGASIKQFLHFVQEMKSEQFGKFDYGTTMNQEIYQQDTPPSYNIAEITAPVSLYYSNNDWLVGVEDVEQLSEELPNLVNLKKISLDKFNHLDFLWARHIFELLNRDVIEEIKSRT